MYSIYILFVANTAPSLTAPNLIRVVLNEATMIPVNVSDADGDDVTVTVDVSSINTNFTARQLSCWKVMFSVMSVCHSVHRDPPIPAHPKMLEFVHYEPHTVGELAVSIQLECFLVNIIFPRFYLVNDGHYFYFQNHRV